MMYNVVYWNLVRRRKSDESAEKTVVEDVSRKASESYSFKTGVGSTLDKNVAKRNRTESKIVGRKTLKLLGECEYTK